jgi:hypothetical protein
VLPKGIVSSAFPSVLAVLLALKLVLDQWQAELAKCILAKDADGLYAADTIVISICRQAGKTFLIGCLVFADCIKNPGTTTVWTAHRFKVSRETFNELKVLAASPLLAPHIDYDAITTAAGNECIPFRNGSRIVFAARERGAIRGFTKVRRLIIDEAQILTEMAMSDLVPTQNQAENPQIILMGTPPKPTDPGEVFSALRAEAIAGTVEGTLYVEFSADPTCESDDWEAVRQANPSFPKRTGKRAILRLRKLLTNDADYRREGLGIWDTDALRSVLPGWAGCAVEIKPPKVTWIGLAVSLDLEWGSIAAAGLWPNGKVHVGAVERRPASAWLAAEAKRIQVARGCLVVLDEKCPDAGLPVALEKAKVDFVRLKLDEYIEACSQVVNWVKERQITHSHTTELDDAIKVAAWRMVGDRKVWGRKQSTADISMLEAATLAARQAAIAPKAPPAPPLADVGSSSHMSDSFDSMGF